MSPWKVFDTTAGIASSYQYRSDLKAKDRNRLMGSLELGFSPHFPYRRHLTLQPPGYLRPGTLRVSPPLPVGHEFTEAHITTYQQADLAYNHQFRPGLDWRGPWAGPSIPDQNRRVRFYTRD